MGTTQLTFKNPTEQYIAHCSVHHATGCSQVSSHNQHLNSSIMFKIKIQGCTNGLQSSFSCTALHQLIIQGIFDLFAKVALLLHNLNLLFLLQFLRWRLRHLRGRVALSSTGLRSFRGLAWHVWVPQAASVLSLLLVFGCWLCTPLAQWTGRALAAAVLWCTSEPRLSLLRRTWETTRILFSEWLQNQMSYNWL